jgi:hypothetical protein
LQTISYELLPGQGDTAVTADNQLLYVTLLANWHLSSALGPAAAAFRRGLGALIPLSWFNLFNAGELNQLLSGGADGGIDVADMKRWAAVHLAAWQSRCQQAMYVQGWSVLPRKW